MKYLPGMEVLEESDVMEQVISAMQEYNYDHWYISGHSLGGAIASSYSYKNSDKLDGIIFLEAYSMKDLSNTNLKVLSLLWK